MPEGAGRVAEHLRFIYAELQRLQPIFGPGQTGAMTTRGVVRNSKPGVAASQEATAPEMAEVVSVLPNHLVVEIPSLDYAETLVLKPRHLMVANYAAYDSTVLSDFRNNSTLPTYTGSSARDWFTVDYLMQSGGYPDDLTPHDLTAYFGGVASGWAGGVQSRNRLVASPNRQGVVPSPRFEMLEVIWPPYFTTSAIGGPVGFGDFEAGNSLNTAFVQSIGGEWVDVNQHARRWKQEAEVSGDQAVSAGYLTNVSPAR